jgi:hypothetical protein
MRAVGLRNEMYGILVVSLGELVKKPFKLGGKRSSGEMSHDPNVMPK